MPPERIGVVIGNGYGGTSCTEEFFEGLLLRGPAGVNPMLFPTTVPNSAASLTSIELKIKGPNSTFCQKDISAEEAIIYAAGLIRKGAADVVIAGGGEELNDVIYHAFTSLDILSKNANGLTEGCRPFDRTRNGRVLGEGAAVLILESLESATRRGARIYAELAGSALTGGLSGISGYSKDTATMVRAMSSALERSGVGSIDYISAAANSTKDLDSAETEAIEKFFGVKAASIPVSSIRPMTGDFEGMGGLRLLTSVLVMREGYIPPTLNLNDPDSGLDHVTGSGREVQVNTVLHNGFGNGGTNACIVLKKPS
jgi:3-oxoacyl-[acyl-carrier-protein] synthase II